MVVWWEVIRRVLGELWQGIHGNNVPYNARAPEIQVQEKKANKVIWMTNRSVTKKMKTRFVKLFSSLSLSLSLSLFYFITFYARQRYTLRFCSLYCLRWLLSRQPNYMEKTSKHTVYIYGCRILFNLQFEYFLIESYLLELGNIRADGIPVNATEVPNILLFFNIHKLRRETTSMIFSKQISATKNKQQSSKCFPFTPRTIDTSFILKTFFLLTFVQKSKVGVTPNQKIKEISTVGLNELRVWNVQKSNE